MSTKIHMVGAKGRMGQAIVHLAEEDVNFEVTGRVDTGDDLFGGIEDCDAVIDFSHHTITEEIAQKTAEAGKMLVIGTTGHDATTRKNVLSVAEKIPVVFASNYAVGVNALFHLTRKAAEIMGEDYDLEVVEMHHKHKKDAPSGTARTLAETLCDVRGVDYNDVVVDGRSGEPGERPKGEIGMHALRGGDVVGEHTVYFAGAGERLELTIRSSSRDSYASGALRAAAWLQGKAPREYSMLEVLGIE
ncbi:MAG: 4-hydroxy-tetrahydrodipicolinate reductase [Verrucomicrobiota bacterium]